MNTWIAAWLFSLLSSCGIYFFARRAQLPRADGLMIAIAAFPAPLFRAVAGHNSLVYGLDFATPLLVWYACRTWNRSDVKMRFAAIAIVVAAGLVPVLIAVRFSSDSNDFQLTGINLYRLLGCMSLMVRCNSIRRRNISLSVNWLYAFSWIALIIALAMAAQRFAGINSDVIGFVDSNTSVYAEHDEAAFNVLGMFRGSIGIFGVLAVCAYSANSLRSLRSQLCTAGGAVAGLLIILLSGSKTSLFIAALLLASKFITAGTRVFAIIIVLGLSLSVSLARLDINDARDLLPRSLLAFVDSGGQERESLDVRTTIWQDCLDSVHQNPGILFGIANRQSMPTSRYGLSTYLPGFFHNEYLSIMMLGGIWSLFGYFLGLGLLLRLLLSHGSAGPAERFAVLAMTSGLAHALSVAHLQPNILFGATTSAAAAIYGFGCPSGRSFAVARGRLTFALQQSMTPGSHRQCNSLPRQFS